MRVLLDEQLPRQLAPYLVGHDVRTVQQESWAGLTNGELLTKAEAAGFTVFVTGDQNLEFQQNISKRPLAVVHIESQRAVQAVAANRVRCGPRAAWLALLGAALIAQSSAVAAQNAGRSLSMEVIRDQCIEFSDVKQGSGPGDYRDCRVSEFSEFGTVGGQIYYYAIYCLMPNQTIDNAKCGDDSFTARFHRARGLAIFARDPARENARLIFDRADREIGAVSYEKPQIIQNAAETLLYLPIVVDGTAVGNVSEYYVRGVDGWESIETKTWLADLRRRLPAGLEIWKGVWPDLRTMQAEAGLYRTGDANCCPSGGIAKIRLAIRAKQFLIDSLVIGTSPSPE